MKTTLHLSLAALLLSAATSASAQTSPKKASSAPSAVASPPVASNVLELPARSPSDGVSFVIRTHNATRTIDCQDCKVVITGNNNALNIHGNCVRLTVAGDNNQVAASTVGSLITPGSNNAVTWSGDQPTIANAGKKNALGAK